MKSFLTPLNETSDVQLRGRAFAHDVMGHRIDPESYCLFQPVLHDRSNKGHGMCYIVCGMVHIKYPLLLIEEISPHSGGSGFRISRRVALYHSPTRNITAYKMC